MLDLEAKMQKHDFLKTKQFRAMVSIDDLAYRKSYVGFSNNTLLDA